MKQQDFFIIWSKLHGDAKVAGIVKAWLIISFALVKPLSKLKFTPNILTLLGLFFGILLYIKAQSPWAALLLVLSLTCDGIDGSLAILTSKFSKWGALLDSTVDRITEIFWLLTLYKIGADIKLLLVIAVFASVQEYLRARAGGLGMSQVGVVTFAERPVRASFIFIALIASAINIAIIPQIVILWLLLQVISFFTITRFVFLNLRQALPIAFATISALIPTSGKPPPGCDEPPTQNNPLIFDRFFVRKKAEAAELLELPYIEPPGAIA